MRGNARKLASANGHASSPAHSRLTSRSSSVSLRAPAQSGASSLADAFGGNEMPHDSGNSADGNGAGGSSLGNSLAHELAAAMMPEPSASSRLLAEELGLDFGDEEAEDEQPTPGSNGVTFAQDDHQLEFASAPSSSSVGSRGVEDDEVATVGQHSRTPSPSQMLGQFTNGRDDEDDEAQEYGVDVGHSPTPRPRNPMARTLFTQPPTPTTPQDPLQQLAQELAATDAFITRLKRIDTFTDTYNNATHSSPIKTTLSVSGSTEPPIERYTSRMIRQLNDQARERESQVRELMSIDKEFRRIEGEMGGEALLGSLEPLEEVEGLFDEPAHDAPDVSASRHHQPLHEIAEEDDDEIEEQEVDEELSIREDDDDDDTDEGEDDPFGEPSTPARTRARMRAPDLPPSPVRRSGAPVTPSSALPHLIHMRDVTTSLIRSLATMSEHAQENGAATADAGRKIKALKNRMTGWQTDWESAERSRIKIEEWESEPARAARVDGRVIVQQQLEAFAKALADAGAKTQAILAR